MTQEQVGEDINLLDLQAMADHVSGKNILTSFAVASADIDQSGKVNLLDGIQLARSLDGNVSPKLILVDSLGSNEVEIWPGANLYLTGVIIGDVDGSYTSII